MDKPKINIEYAIKRSQNIPKLVKRTQVISKANIKIIWKDGIHIIFKLRRLRIKTTVSLITIVTEVREEEEVT